MPCSPRRHLNVDAWMCVCCPSRLLVQLVRALLQLLLALGGRHVLDDGGARVGLVVLDARLLLVGVVKRVVGGGGGLGLFGDLVGQVWGVVS